MMSTLILRPLSAFLVVVMLLASCKSTTSIQSIPPEAKVYVDGVYKGITPYTYTSTNIIGTETHVKLEKEGYETKLDYFARDEEIDVVPAVAGFFVWIPWLWAMKYYPVHTFKLEPIKDEVAPAPVTPGTSAPAPTKSEGSEFTTEKAKKLRELKALHDEGILTEEEYKTEKQKILNTD